MPWPKRYQCVRFETEKIENTSSVEEKRVDVKEQTESSLKQ